MVGAATKMPSVLRVATSSGFRVRCTEVASANNSLLVYLCLAGHVLAGVK